MTAFFKTPVKRSAGRPLPQCDSTSSINGVPINDVNLYRIDHLYRRWLPWLTEHICRSERSYRGAGAFILKSRLPQSEYTMNIFYIIGVIVVVLFVAGFFGLHA
jgi:hypothetical protein